MVHGARPGPACFSLGGTEPTVTDANLVLGRLGVARMQRIGLTKLSLGACDIRLGEEDPSDEQMRRRVRAFLRRLTREVDCPVEVPSLVQPCGLVQKISRFDRRKIAALPNSASASPYSPGPARSRDLELALFSPRLHRDRNDQLFDRGEEGQP